ncbi:MAG: nucleoside/nucleotide kinase family protein [Anaerolineae bacterium]|nr:nucleoside/nucleotide kinase family protein [Anaerolineae bacterium]
MKKRGNPLRPGVWEHLSRSSLFLDKTDVPLEIDRGQIEQFYHPLATDLLLQSRSVPRLMVAVAGPPGSGKTAFATILVAVINAETGDNVAALVGLDGWHHTNAYLATHSIERDGKRIALRSIKGAPETFDATAAYGCLSAIRRGGQVSFPVYSRRLHEPIPAEGTIESSHRIVLAEGNYLLLDEGHWSRFRPLFDVRMFVSATIETLIAGLRERHLRGGKTAAATERHIREVDLPNAARVGPSVLHAHVVAHKADTRRIDRIQWSKTL